MIELNSVTCGYRGNDVIHGVSLSIAKGSFVGIIGPNGAGKTTLFRVITRILRPREGKVYFEREDLYRLPRLELARRIATMPQLLEVPFPFTVEDFVALGRFPHAGRFGYPRKDDDAVIEECLALTDTLELRSRNFQRLSGGERQRAMLAQALAQKPELLLLDEPTSHLDIGHQIEILDLIRQLNRGTGLTVIMVNHDLNLASEYCDRIILLHEGKIYRDGAPGDVLTYQSLEEVYRTVVVVKENPVSKKPYVFPVSRETLGSKQSSGA